ncbi:MAG TPA: hypothetical protein PLQ49_02785 [Methanothrix sp.]|nr:hypothetical protein [Methanothrix sp.]
MIIGQARQEMVEEEVMDGEDGFAKDNSPKTPSHPHKHCQKVYESPSVIL